MRYVAIYFLVKSVSGEITLARRSENPVYLKLSKKKKRGRNKFF